MRLIAHDIRSLHNVGSLFRSADAFGVEKIYLTGMTGTPPRKEIAKVALGSEHRIPWEQRADVKGLIQELQKQGWFVCALETGKDTQPLTHIKISQEKMVLLVGNEVEGLSSEICGACDAIAEISMPGVKRSLNVSVAAGIALFWFHAQMR